MFCKKPAISAVIHVLNIYRCLTAMGIGIACFISGTTTLGTTRLSTLYKIGFGTVSPDAIVNFETGGLITTVLFANLPQTILSFLYLFYNGLYSSFLAANEWSKFGHTQKSLRVTNPQGLQRSTYFLSLPYRYGIVSLTNPSDRNKQNLMS
jgi:hypothetical protein